MSLPVTTEPLPLADRQTIAPILEIVRRTMAVDFSQYRTATVQRRLRNRMITVGAKTLDDYLGLIRTCPDEVERLAERLTIKVSRFYRNSPVFEALRREILPRLVSERGGRPLQIWVSGCGCGEEAYTLAMLLEECGADGVIAATDVDAFALRSAERGVYPPAAVQELPAELADRYLRPVRQRGSIAYEVDASLRARVRLHRHDVISGVPGPFGPGACTLVSCRNVLIYLQKDAQERALQALLDALAPRGVLVLGEAEWPTAPVLNALEVVAHKARIFRAVATSSGDLR